MYGDSEFVCLGEFASGGFAREDPAGLLADGTADLAAVLFDEFAGFFAFHARECAGDDGGLPLEKRLYDALEFGGAAECYEFVDFLRVALGVEEVVDGLSDAFADVIHVLQILYGGGTDRFERAEVLREVSGAGAAHEADTETVQQVFEATSLGGGDGVKDVFGALLGHAFLRFEVFECKAVQVRDALDFTRGNQACDKGGAEIFDVHGLAAYEMLEQALHLRRAVHVFAAENDFIVDVGERFAANGAFFGGGHGDGPRRAEFFLDVGNFRDDFAALLDADGVAVMQVQARDFVEVVEGGALDGGAREAHGCKVRYGRDCTGAAHLEFNRKERRVGALGLELIGDGPARALARCTQRTLHGEVVQLHDHAVDFEGEAVAARANLLRNFHDFIGGIGCPVVVRVEPEALEL